jgi:hypothetical protein
MGGGSFRIFLLYCMCCRTSHGEERVKSCESINSGCSTKQQRCIDSASVSRCCFLLFSVAFFVVANNIWFCVFYLSSPFIGCEVTFLSAGACGQWFMR